MIFPSAGTMPTLAVPAHPATAPVLWSCLQIVMRARGAVHVLLNAPATPPHISSFVVSGMAYRGAASHGIVPEVDALPSVFLHHAGGGGALSVPGGAGPPRSA